jgi:hypothetical protein
MTPWSLEYEEFAALCEQLLGTSTPPAHSQRPDALPPHRGFRGLWARYGAVSGGPTASGRRGGLRRGFGFPRTGR